MFRLSALVFIDFEKQVHGLRGKNARLEWEALCSRAWTSTKMGNPWAMPYRREFFLFFFFCVYHQVAMFYIWGIENLQFRGF